MNIIYYNFKRGYIGTAITVIANSISTNLERIQEPIHDYNNENIFVEFLRPKWLLYKINLYGYDIACPAIVMFVIS